MLPGGMVTRRGVGFTGDESGMQAGTVVPALDTGDPIAVFPRHGDRNWLGDVVIAAIAIIMIVLSVRRWITRRRDQVNGPGDPATSPSARA